MNNTPTSQQCLPPFLYSVFSFGQFPNDHLTLGPPRRWPCPLLPHFHVPQPHFLPSHHSSSSLLVSKVPESDFLPCSPLPPSTLMLLPSPLVILVEPPLLRHSSPPAPSTVLSRGLAALSASLRSYFSCKCVVHIVHGGPVISFYKARLKLT